jgi:hypothetical protein
MHEHNVVHLSVQCLCFSPTVRLNDNALGYYSDIAPQNMVVEESRLVSRGSPWRNPESHSGFTGHFFSWKNRCSLRPAIKYYCIDFGLSRHYSSGKESARIAATLRTFPMISELSLTVPYNPFYVDVFQLGLAMSGIIDVRTRP